MNRATIYIAHQDDLYVIQFDTLDMVVLTVLVYPDSRGSSGVELNFWTLPRPLQERIYRKMREYVGEEEE